MRRDAAGQRAGRDTVTGDRLADSRSADPLASVHTDWLRHRLTVSGPPLNWHPMCRRRADWLVMATRLVLLRSRLLFPATPEAAEEAEREAAQEIAQLDELQFIRSAASWLQARPQLGRDVFARAPPGPDPQIASYMALMEACLTVLRGREQHPGAEPIYRPAIPDVYRVPEAIMRMRALVAELTEPKPLEDFCPEIPVERRSEVDVVRSCRCVDLYRCAGTVPRVGCRARPGRRLRDDYGLSPISAGGLRVRCLSGSRNRLGLRGWRVTSAARTRIDKWMPWHSAPSNPKRRMSH